MWKNDDGSTTMSQRYASGYSQPQPTDAPPRVATMVQPKELLVGLITLWRYPMDLIAAYKSHPARTTTFAFQVPANKSLLASSDPKEHLIFGISTVKPDKDAGAALARHQHTGYFTFDLTKEFVPQDKSGPKNTGPSIQQGTNLAYKKFEKLIILHGFLVSVGFLVLLPAGSLIARYGRTFTPKWFKLHQLSNGMIAGPVITLGVLLGPVVVYSKTSFRIHLANSHEVRQSSRLRDSKT